MVLGVTLQLRTRHVRGGHSSPPSLGHGSTCAPTERRESQESTVGDVCGTLWAQRQVHGATPSTLRAATLQLPGLHAGPQSDLAKSFRGATLQLRTKVLQCLGGQGMTLGDVCGTL